MCVWCDHGDASCMQCLGKITGMLWVTAGHSAELEATDKQCLLAVFVECAESLLACQSPISGLLLILLHHCIHNIVHVDLQHLSFLHCPNIIWQNGTQHAATSSRLHVQMYVNLSCLRHAIHNKETIHISDEKYYVGYIISFLWPA